MVPILFYDPADLAAYDSDYRLLYIVEFRGNTDQPLNHVWFVGN